MNNPTTYKTYISDAKRTEPDYTAALGRVFHPQTIRLLHGAMGLATESGEFLDVLKKHIFYGKPWDIANMKEECGDLFWYLAILADAMGEHSFTKIMQTNIAKLRQRYPEKFEEQQAVTRNLPAERQILEGQKCAICGAAPFECSHSIDNNEG
jgi:NTP pyrophosphatase (non-canonical NTP hydrolase)